MSTNDEHWHVVIQDLSYDEFRVTQLPPHRVQRGTCEACRGALTPPSYAVHVELPLVIDTDWHFFGDVCWDCMLTIVANGGYPLSWNSARELGTAAWEDRDQW